MDNVDQIYKGIAFHIVEQIEEGWESAKISVEFFGDSAEFDVIYTNLNGKVFDLDAGYDLFKLFKDLNTIIAADNSNKWNRSVFELAPSGQFKIDFSWDQELADEIERLNND